MTIAAETRNQTSTSRVLALAGVETRLVLRNRTLLVSSLIVPLFLGVFWLLTFNRDGGAGAVLALQVAVALGMGLYVSATQTLVARRQSKVLKRLRTTGLTDGGLIAAVIAPSVVIALGQLVIFAVIDVVIGLPIATDPLALAFVVIGGLALTVGAAVATSVVTPSAERAQITTLPLTFLLLGAAIAMSFLPMEGWFRAVLIVPGAGLGVLARYAVEGGMWADGTLTGLLPMVATLLWAGALVRFARKRFRWDPRL